MSHAEMGPSGSVMRPRLIAGLLAVVLTPATALAQSQGAKDLFFGEQHPSLVAEKRIQPTTANAADSVRPQPAAQGTASPATKANPSTTPTAPTAKPTHPGLRVWLTDANDATGTKRLSPQQTFRTGDRVRLSLQSNRDGYLYVLNVGTSGETRLLYPRPGTDNRVQRFKDFSFSSPLVFSEPSGTEQLVVVLSSAPTQEVSVTMHSGGMQRVSLQGSGKLASGKPAAPSAEQPAPAQRTPPRQVQAGAQGGGRDAASDSLDLALADLRGSKDLKFDDDGAELVAVSNRSDERPGSFAPVVVNLRLTHKR